MPLLFSKRTAQRCTAQMTKMPRRCPDAAQMLPRWPENLPPSWLTLAWYFKWPWNLIRTKLDLLSLLPRNFYTYMIYVMIATAGVTTVTIANYSVTWSNYRNKSPSSFWAYSSAGSGENSEGSESSTWSEPFWPRSASKPAEFSPDPRELHAASFRREFPPRCSMFDWNLATTDWLSALIHHVQHHTHHTDHRSAVLGVALIE